MADDNEERSSLAELRTRENFPGLYKEPMLRYALKKGDVEGIFSDDGLDASIGNQAIPSAGVVNG